MYISLQVGKGFVRVLRCDEYRVADIVPVDLVNNMLLSIGWVTGVSPSPSPIIYHFTSGTVNPMNWLQLCELTSVDIRILHSIHNFTQTKARQDVHNVHYTQDMECT